MSTLRFSERADRDLDRIWEFIAEDNLGAAAHFVNFVENRCRLLAENPLMGRARPELAPDLRSFPAGGYVIFYVPLQDGVEIVRVVSAARDVETLF